MYLLIEKGTTFYLKSIPLIEVKPVALHVQKQHKTDDGGITWAAPTTSVFEGLLSVHFTDINTGYAVGQYGTILKSNNGGSTWAPLSSGTFNLLYSVFFTGINNGYAVGDEGTTKFLMKYST